MSFVNDLRLDIDPRLVTLRTPPDRPIDRVRRDVDPPSRSTTPAVIDDSLRAAVNGAALVCFVSGISVQQKSDVLYSMQLAQRAATAQFDRVTSTQDWYGRFIDVLERLGWLGDSLAFTERSSTAGDFSLDRSALDVIQAVATGNQLAILVKTLNVLKKLGDTERALTHLIHHARVKDRKSIAKQSTAPKAGVAFFAM